MASTELTLKLRCEPCAITADAPPPRSAHNCVSGPDNSLYITAGDSGVAGQRFQDTWQLCSCSSTGTYKWQQVHPLKPQQQQQQERQGCTARSNAAAVAAGGWLLLFGGWSSSGLEPLSHLEAFHFSTSTWHTPAPAGTAPSPRGQPAAATDSAGTVVYIFGGWDGQQRFNDLHKLTVGDQQPGGWAWQQVMPQQAPPKGARAGITFQQQQAAQQQPTEVSFPQQQQKQGEVQLPCERADHVMVCWHYCDDGTWKDLLVVFGGSCSQGLLNDTWLFDINTSSWTQAYYGGAAPCARSSCAAAVTGDVLLVHGGQTPAGVLHDLHLLNLSTLTWLQVDLGDVVYPLCRHSMGLCSDMCLVFGGYDGSSASNTLLRIDLQPLLQLRRKDLQDLISSMAGCDPKGSSIKGFDQCLTTDKVRDNRRVDPFMEASHTGTEADEDAEDDSKLKAVGVVPGASLLPVPPVVKALSKKAAPPPLRLADLPNAEEVAALPQWKQVRQLHLAAVAAGCDQYIDPKTGYTVFTARYLQQRQCCGNKCRHCPHGWANVAKQRLQPAAGPGAASDRTESVPAAADVPEW